MKTNAETALQEFARSGDHSAFAQVVECLSGLVFSSAMRRTGDHEIAQEVTQNVFAILARKAKRVANHPSLEGWLYTTTRLESASASRKRQQHQRKIEAVRAQLQSGTEMNDTDLESWREAIPHLHDSLDRLAETEREILLARFFAKNSFAEISTRFGKSEAACKMRVKRSLEKLNAWMSKRGATLSIGALATGLSTEWCEAAAPTSLASTLSTDALAAAPTITGGALLTNAIMTMKTSKLSVILAAGILSTGSIPSIIQYSHGNSLKRQIDALRPVDSATVDRIRLGEHVQKQPTANTPASRFLERPFVINNAEAFIDRIAIAKRRNDHLELTGAYAAIAELSDVALEKLIIDVAKSKTAARKRKVAQRLLIMLVSLREKVNAPVFSEAIASTGRIRGLEKTMARFARDQPSAALDWFRSQQDQGLLEGKGTETALTADVVEALISGLAQSSPENVLALLKEVPEGKDRQSVEAKAVAALLKAGDRARMIALTRVAEESDLNYRSALAANAATYASNRGLTIDEAAAFLWECEITDQHRAMALGSIVRNDPKLSLAEQGDWLAGHVREGAVESFETFVRRSLKEQPKEYREWVEALPRGTARDRAYFEEGDTHRRNKDFATAIVRFDAIEDESLRTSEQERLLKFWARENPGAARTAATQRNIPLK